MTEDIGSAQRLAERTLALVDVPSVSRDEAAITAYVAAQMPSALDVLHDDGESMLYATPGPADRPFVVLAGHLDTVPAQDNLPGRIEDGWVVGLGASDMKGGLAVMLELARWLTEAAMLTEVSVGFLFFGREELPLTESPLTALLEEAAALARADLAVVLEPTDNTIQAGCVGTVNATLTFHGESAHSARPWTGVNAITVAVEALGPIVSIPRRELVIDGLPFSEVLSVTRISGGVADNVIPASVSCNVNYRFAPTRSRREAEEELRALIGEAGQLEITSFSPAARVVSSTPLVERLRAAGEFAVEPKQAWTPVAQFSEAGIDAVNLGPGATAFAHRQDERIEVRELVRTFDALARFVAAGS
ncbi:MAG: succinyl-diaminopimelate desuccinylase [Actinomycetia bacterium]|nr:succinyl-diaminopimelate desuccinylase [Actinomycetes bacterium]